MKLPLATVPIVRQPQPIIPCQVCAGPVRRGECFACRVLTPSGRDPRWARWAAHLAAHPELRPVMGIGGNRVLVPGAWSTTKCLNVDAWVDNQRSVSRPLRIEDFMTSKSCTVAL